MKKYYFIILSIITIFVSACSQPSDFYEKFDGVPFELFDSFEYDGLNYEVSLASDVNENLAYYYKHLDNTSSNLIWIVNYSETCDYISEYYIGSDFYKALYGCLVGREADLKNMINSDIKIYPDKENVIIEGILNNDTEGEVGCIVVGEYLPIKVTSSKDRYLIFIPINAYICMYKDNYVYNFKGNDKISLSDLNLEYKILERE